MAPSRPRPKNQEPPRSVIEKDDPLAGLAEATKKQLADQQLEAFGQRLYVDEAELEILEALDPEDRQNGRPPNPRVQGDEGERSDEDQMEFLRKRIRRYRLAVRIWTGKRDLIRLLDDETDE